MYLVYFWDGTVAATDTQEDVTYLETTYKGEIQSVTFTDNVEFALEKCDWVF